jgi:nickel/cobalt exporter
VTDSLLPMRTAMAACQSELARNLASRNGQHPKRRDASFLGMPRRTRPVLLALMLALVVLGALPTSDAAAHPLGNFSVNQYTRIALGQHEVRLTYVLDLAELPTVADRPLLDGDGDGEIEAVEREAYLNAKIAEVVSALHLASSTTALPLRVLDQSLVFVPGQAGLETTRIEATLAADLPVTAAEGRVTFHNDYATERLGWREIVVTHGPNLRLDGDASLSVDQSDALRTYPDDLLSSPLDERTVAFPYEAVPGAPASTGEATNLSPAPVAIGERLGAIVNGGDLSTGGLLLALAAAAAWGAVHALSPGHGKTVVGAYLVGSRGTPRHALFLGLTVTITHTAGVLALGLVVLFASRTILPEQLYPWLSLISGLLVAALGLTILRQRLLGLPAFGHHHDPEHDHVYEHADHHDHGDDHAHAHAHAHGLPHSHDGRNHNHLPPGAAGEGMTWRSLLALGISGGLLPCPSALLALLGAVAVGRAGFGVLVVIAFSIGLATTLTGVGLLFLYAGRVLERQAVAGRWSSLLQFAPAVAALAVTTSGVLIVARAVMDLQRL